MAEKQSKDEQIGIHKGSLSTLVKERQELMRLVNIVEQLMQMHIGALKELGVDVEKQAKEVMKDGGSGSKKKAPIEDIL